MTKTLSEDIVYVGAKRWLRANDWVVLAGQPPSGCDHLPVVEIKSPEQFGKGSRGALKPDLIAAKGDALLLVECKPAFSEADAAKLRAIMEDSARVTLLFAELRQRGLLEKAGWTPSTSVTRVHGALAHSANGNALRGILKR